MHLLSKNSFNINVTSSTGDDIITKRPNLRHSVSCCSLHAATVSWGMSCRCAAWEWRCCSIKCAFRTWRESRRLMSCVAPETSLLESRKGQCTSDTFQVSTSCSLTGPEVDPAWQPPSALASTPSVRLVQPSYTVTWFPSLSNESAIMTLQRINVKLKRELK